MSTLFSIHLSVPGLPFPQARPGCSGHRSRECGVSLTARNLCFTLIAALLWCSGSRLGATQAESWDIVRSLTSGQEIRVETTDRKVRGSLLSVSQSSLSLSTDTSEVNIPRSDVMRVFVRGKSHRLRNALIGAGIGAACGIVVTSTLGVLIANESGENIAAEAISLPTAIGAGIGAVLPTGGFQKIYDSGIKDRQK